MDLKVVGQNASNGCGKTPRLKMAMGQNATTQKHGKNSGST
jgi:hypothetical protein